MQGAYGQMGGAMQGMPGMGYAGGAGAKPTMRNAFAFGLLPELVLIFLPTIISIIAGITGLDILYSLIGLFNLACYVWWSLNGLKALNELRNAAGNPTMARWPGIVPVYQWLFYLTVVPKEVMKAKQMRGLQPTHKSLALYFLFPVFALQGDLNELAAAPG
jgi:hypothetical protein